MYCFMKKKIYKVNNSSLQNWEKTWLGIFPKMTCKWLTGIWKDAQHHSSSEKCKSKTTVRYYLTLGRMAAIQKSTNNKCWRGCGEKGTLLHCWSECKLVQLLQRTVWRFLKRTGNRTAIWPSNPTAGHTHRGNQNWRRHMYPNVHRSTVYNSQDMETT